MKKVLILCHPDFSAMGKFKRKLNKIFSKLNDYKVFYFEDHHGLIKDYFPDEVLERLLPDLFEKIPSINLTHAVIFDSNSKPQYVYIYEGLVKKIPVRYIKDKITFVSNKDRGEDFDTYCGRGTLWGNPYAIGIDGDREEVIRKFKYDFDRDYLKGGKEFKEKLKELRGNILGCHCKPYACHVDVLARYLNEMDDGE
ncbi:TPA: DUF4326 domain-containing protein [Morganella morganii]